MNSIRHLKKLIIIDKLESESEFHYVERCKFLTRVYNSPLHVKFTNKELVVLSNCYINILFNGMSYNKLVMNNMRLFTEI
jgi:hypothetical protein